VRNLQVNLRRVYMHRTDVFSSFIEALFQSKSIIELFNTLYYQRKLIDGEVKLISEIRQKQKELNQFKEERRNKKHSIALAVNETAKLQGLISAKKREQYGLVNRLRKKRVAYEQAERQLEKESNKITRKILEMSDGSGLGLEDLIRANFSYPVRASITSSFGYRMHPIFRVRSFHSGIDLGARHGTPVKASNGGLIIYSGWYSGYGKTVIVSHGNGKSTLYAHMSRISVNNNQKVAQGQTIGYVGSTGYSTGPHLHFEYRLKGKPNNPLLVLR
ncbi:MAG TPA: peptidoglycan DD-metalloendopeptidase family protein, partial [Vampirovibrionales bacterium]